MHSMVLAVMLCLGLFGYAQETQGSSTTGDKGAKAQENKAQSSDMDKAAAKPTGAKAGSMDKRFVMEAAQGGLSEVALGTLAQQKASKDEVKQFGQRMVTDHTKANDELKSLAQQKNWTLPTEPSAKQKAEQQRLEKLSGDAFDKAYMHHMVTDHTKDVAEFRRASKSASDSDLKSWAGTTLPTLEDHLKQATQVAGTTGGTMASKKSEKAKSEAKTSDAQPH
ncbi:MAG TPA: DUF4142 domain-containing protein [Clostridia bacterium]|nr:DUF4142 domain-containing protein [Clostridia bacterium]